MTTIVTRAGKGSALTHAEMDANFTNLNNDLTVHIDDTIDAHVSSAISYLPAGTGATVTNVQTKLRESVSVKDFGAVGDGVTDDTAAIQSALNSSSVSIYVPSGRYKITENLTRSGHTKLYGDGLGASTIVFAGNCGFVFSGGSGADHYNMSHLQIEDMAFECTAVNTGAVIDASWTDGIGGTSKSFSIKNVDITGTSASGGFAHGIKLTNARNVRIDNVRCMGDRDAPPIASGTGLTLIGGNPNGAPVETFVTAFQTYFLTKGIDVSGWVEGLYINQSTFIACHYGIVTNVTPQRRPLLFVSNSHFNTDQFGVLNIGFVQVNVAGNSFYCVDIDGTSSAYVGIQFDASGAKLDSHIRGNDFQGISGIASKIGIVIANDGSYAENVQIDGNTFSSLGTGVLLQSGTSGAIVTDTNTFTGVTTSITDSGTNNSCVGSYSTGGSAKEFPDGLQVRFGSSIISLNANGDGVVAFSPAFQTACLVAIVNNGDQSASGNLAFAVNATSKTSMTFSVRPNPGAVAVRVNWIALGN